MLSSITGNASSSRTLLRSINRTRTPLHCSHTHAASSFHFQSPLPLQRRSLSSSTVGTRFLSFQNVRALGHTSFAAQKGTRSFFSTPKPELKENGGGQSQSDSNHHTRELEAIFRKELDRVKGRVNEPDVSVQARRQRSALLKQAQSDLERWEAHCGERRTSGAKPTETRTIKEQAQFLWILNLTIGADSLSLKPLWTAQERKEILTKKKAVEDKLHKDPRYSKSSVFLHFLLDLVFQACIFGILWILWPF